MHKLCQAPKVGFKPNIYYCDSLLDTNVIVGHVNGDEVSTRLIDERDEVELYASIITRIELFSRRDLPLGEHRRILQFLRQVIVVDINKEVEKATIRIRRNTRLKLPDSVIAATAVALQAPLVTFDRSLASLRLRGLRTIIPV
jgi:predicted nucleic acid-binding protein